MALMDSKGMSKNDPILIRAYKKESEMEVWKRGSNGRYALLKTYPDLPLVGPARAEGPRGRPSGAGGLLHDHARADEPELATTTCRSTPASRMPMTSSIGRTGSLLMVHGSCSSPAASP